MDTDNDEQLARNLQLAQNAPEQGAGLQVSSLFSFGIFGKPCVLNISAAAARVPQSLLVTAH